jgi:hypothetical protein
MNSEEIRARISGLEAEASQRARSTGRPPADDDVAATPWQDLFDASWPGQDGPDYGDEFSLNNWLADGFRGLRALARHAGLNDEFWRHVRGAERELLLAVRALVDARLEMVEDRDENRAANERVQEIEIDF